MTFKDYVKANARLRGNQVVHGSARRLTEKLGFMSQGQYRNKLLELRSNGGLSAEDYEYYLDVLESLVRARSIGEPIVTPLEEWEPLPGGGHRRRTFLGSSSY